MLVISFILFQVLPSDNLPKSLCDSCHDLLNQFSKFKRACIKSNDALIRMGGYVKSDPDESKALQTCNDVKPLLAVDVKTENEASEPSLDGMH